MKPPPRLCLVLLVACPALPALAQQDSLWAAWGDTRAPDSARARALHEFISEGCFFTNPDSALALSQTLLDFTVARGQDRATVETLNLRGYVLFRTGAYPEALDAYRRGAALAERVGHRTALGVIHLRTGYVYHDNEDILTALTYYERARALFEATGDEEGLANLYNEFGNIYRGQEEYDKALEYYRKGIALRAKPGKPDDNDALYSNTGQVYLALEDYPRALEYFRKALAISERHRDRLGVASALTGVADVYAATDRRAEALRTMRESLAIDRGIGNALGASHTQIAIGYLLVDDRRYDEALAYTREAFATSERLGDIGNLESSAALLYEVYRGKGMLGEALEYRERQAAYADSLEVEATVRGLQRMEFRAQVVADSLRQNEKDARLALAHAREVQEKVDNRNLAIGASVVFLLLAGGFFSRWRYVRRSRAAIARERDRSEGLLLNILPAEVAAELKATGEATARDFEMVSVMFTDFKGFTEQSAALTAAELLAEINHCFGAFDRICERHGVEKIKTIGDAYMAAGGLPVYTEDAARRTVLAALEMQAFVGARLAEQRALGRPCFEMRLGINTGPVVAGIVGVKKFQYDLWGDTVNTAARMESAGAVGRVNISRGTYEALEDDPGFAFEPRGAIEAKGKGALEMWFVTESSGG